MAVNLMRQKQYPAGEALVKACELTFHEWTRVKGSEVVTVHESVTDTGMLRNAQSFAWMIGDRGPRSRSPRASGGRQREQKTYSVGGARYQLNGRTLCGGFNTGKCKGRCPKGQEHVCGYIINERGDICDSTDHGRCDHDKGRKGQGKRGRR